MNSSRRATETLVTSKPMESSIRSWIALGAKRCGAVAVAGAGLVAAGAVGSAAISSSSASKARKTMTAALQNYERIDLDELQKSAIATARENAVNSMQLERELTPDIANTRETLSKQISSELAMGGQLSEDVINQVSRNAASKANTAGLYGGGGPITAAMLGLTSMDVAQQRKQNAAALLAANPAPKVGLSPETLASVKIADINNWNQAQLDVAGVKSNISMQNGANMANAITSATSTIGGAMMGGKFGGGATSKGLSS